MENQVFDTAGIGIGPNNLSVGALSSRLSMKSIFFERKDSLFWHEGMMIEGCTLQNNITKDLVTLVDPTSEFTLTNYLYSQNRIYEFISSGQNRILREEYNHYLNWVASKIDNIKYSSNVIKLIDKKEYYEVVTDRGSYKAKNICVSIGRPINHPFKCNNDTNDLIIHSSDYMYHKNKYKGKRIAIIGGGQSAAEIFKDLTSSLNKPREIQWITRRSNLQQITESCFDNEFFTPEYVNNFMNLEKDKRKELLKEQIMTSDGINPELLQDIYQFLYKNKYLRNNEVNVKILVRHEVLNIQTNNKVSIEYKSNTSCLKYTDQYDYVIACTGYKQNETPEIIKDLDLNYVYFI